MRAQAMLRPLMMLMFAVSPGGAAADTQTSATYTVDHLLKTELIAGARLAAGGRQVVVEHGGPYESASMFRNYAKPLYPVANRSRLYVADLEGTGELQQLFQQAPAEHHQLISVSPGGAYVCYLRATQSSSALGVYEFASRKTREFEPVPNNSFAPLWVSDTTLVFAATAGTHIPPAFVDAMADEWRAMRDGRRATANALGAGRYASMSRPVGGLVAVDVKTGSVRELGAGRFVARAASADGSYLAAVRGQFDGAPRELLESFRLPHERTPLVVYDLAHGDREHAPCNNCDVLPDSLTWSPAGAQLAFVARESGKTWEEARLWVYEPATDVARPVELGPLSLAFGKDAWFRVLEPRFTWLGGALVINASMKSASNEGPGTSEGWFLLRRGATPLNLLASFGTTPVSIVGVTARELLVVAAGEAWAISAKGRRRLLTAQVKESIRPARLPASRIDRQAKVETRLVTTLMLEAGPVGNADHTDSTLLLLDVRTGAVSTMVAPPAAASMLDVSMDARRAVYVDTHESVTELKTSGPADSARTLLRINSHLRGVARGQPFPLEHVRPDGQRATSWIVMPPGWRPGQSVPTVVEIYPGRTDAQARQLANANLASGLISTNLQPLVGHGYALLLPSLPLSSEVPRDTLDGLAGSVLSAVDAAIAAGYAKPDRLAIQGISFGGYGTLGVIAETKRFRAAVALAGAYDLISQYGTPRIGYRLVAQSEGLNFASVSLMETGQQGLGAQPWRDVDRYLRNSPLMRVDSIETPVLLMHGDLDETVHFTQSEEMFTALARLNKDAMFVRYWGEGHGFASPANIRDQWARILAWYDEWIGPPYRQ